MALPKHAIRSRERRRALRVALRASVDFTSTDNFYASPTATPGSMAPAHHAITRDISSGGIFIETDVVLPEGTEINLRLTLVERVYHVAGEVAWHLAAGGKMVGMGVRFLRTPPAVAQAIKKFMEQRAPLQPGETDEPIPRRPSAPGAPARRTPEGARRKLSSRAVPRPDTWPPRSHAETSSARKGPPPLPSPHRTVDPAASRKGPPPLPEPVKKSGPPPLPQS